MSDEQLYWWFEPPGGVLANGDGRKPEAGITHAVDGDLVLCERGLHASARLLDALQYAKSSIVWRVRLGGMIIHDNDKAVASERTYLERYEIDDILRIAARHYALEVIHLWDAPAVVREYLETGNEDLRAAASAAVWDAASAASAASDAAWDAARYTARDAKYAASAAARYAARYAASAAVWDAASAASDASSAASAARYAARYTAWYAARYAARERQNDYLEALVLGVEE